MGERVRCCLAVCALLSWPCQGHPVTLRVEPNGCEMSGPRPCLPLPAGLLKKGLSDIWPCKRSTWVRSLPLLSGARGTSPVEGLWAPHVSSPLRSSAKWLRSGAQACLVSGLSI